MVQFSPCDVVKIFFERETLDICWYQHEQHHELWFHSQRWRKRKIRKHCWLQTESPALKCRKPIHAEVQNYMFQRCRLRTEKFLPRLAVVHVGHYLVVARCTSSVFVFKQFSKNWNAEKCPQSFAQRKVENLLRK